jgi:hypothetical protein
MEARGLSILWPLRPLQLQVSGAGVNNDPLYVIAAGPSTREC